ncbi:proline and serine-rich protein 2 [Notolabrus celidotus]|uniref:proline and serine-rich protein 2 n=1 Tax=Notolabrus celidotus TaxID=1203425 RepID=UPI0014902B45|nr:proline and serine-rich protein 2 [Notolabrus celidotus]
MDLHLQGNPQLHYGVNGGAGRNPRPGADDTLKFLSREERECLQFFEKTIDSLEDGLEDTDRKQRQMRLASGSSAPVSAVDGPTTRSQNPGVMTSSFQSPKDQDIIDLVRPNPDLVQTREPIFNPTNPDFHNMMQTPGSHFQIKPRRDHTDSLPSEYNPPLPSGSYGPTDSHSSYHPPGSIPTPVLIAQKIAENQGGGPANITPASLLRRLSLESEKPVNYGTDQTGRHGPPTSAKPSRLPSNISMVHSGKDHQSQSLPNVNLNERRSQMLANLAGTAHPLLQEDSLLTVEQKERNVPTRSISFKDPSPDKSRMEALSKLGLNRDRAMSGGTSLLVPPDSTRPDPPPYVEPSPKPVEVSVPPTVETSNKIQEAYAPAPRPRQIQVDSKPEVLRRDSVDGHEDRNLDQFPPPPPPPESSYYPPPLEIKAPLPPPVEVTQPEFNTYGGKSFVINPTVTPRSEPTISPTIPEPKNLPSALASPSEFNDYGGKTKVINVAPVVTPRSNLPDILSSHIDKSQILPSKPELSPAELNSYGGKSRVINPSVVVSRPSESPGRSFKAPAPTPAPKPPRHSYHGAVTPQKPTHSVLLPDHRRRSSMFRPQSITVQFSGKGAMDESRRDALRKLGLLK